MNVSGFLFFISFVFKDFIYLFMTERERERERERQRQRQKEKQGPCREPDAELDPGIKTLTEGRCPTTEPTRIPRNHFLNMIKKILKGKDLIT